MTGLGARPGRGAATLDDVLAEVRELRCELRDLRSGLLPRPRPPLVAADRAWLGALLPAAHAALGDAVFLVQDLATAALRAEGAALAVVLAADHVAGDSLRRLGKTLRRCTGYPVAGLVLRRVGESSAGVLWEVAQTDETPASASNGSRVAA